MRRTSPSSAAANQVKMAFAADALKENWQALHRGDQEPYPDSARLTRLGKRHASFAAWVKDQGGPKAGAEGVQDAWRDFHAGRFAHAIEAGGKLGALGATVANKAAAIHSLEDGLAAARALKMLEAATARGERAVESLPDDPNAHYMLALVLGRYSQRISILQALATGLATRVRKHLETTLELEPRHAEAHLALGLYHAEVVAKIGALLASLTYQASAESALEHFRRAIKLIPHSPIAHVEYANGLLLLDARAHREQIRTLYEQAAAHEPLDAMERLDVERAQRGPP